ncbi:hypothetical protein EPI10_005396 [Gossypium australe]|uniref:Uncharacterized protein n=1 Tax=Gossypium australe TaxID=47621 RepID=A0A5B6WPR5_9ROSI|nr:hypothetical protein EPI10_005396 [Gossypium australe]
MTRQNVQQNLALSSSSMEDLLKEYMAKNDAIIQRQPSFRESSGANCQSIKLKTVRSIAE